MKRLFIFVLLTCMLTVSAAAVYIPDNEVCENRDGRQLIIKTYHLAPGDDPGALIEDGFERESYAYSYMSIVKDEKQFESRKAHSETVTIETDSDDLTVILAALDATLPYSDGEYSGVLALDHTSLYTEATGYTTKSYTVSETKTYEGLDRNDPGYVPKTTVKDGRTLTLSNIEWSVQGTGMSGDTLVATQYMAIATYTGSASSRKADGYITKATYTGEIVSSGVASIEYTVTYLGEPIPASEPEPEPEPEPTPEPTKAPLTLIFIIAGACVLIAAAGVTAYLLLRKNTKVYALSETGLEYELIGTIRLDTQSPSIDLRTFGRYPADSAVIEIAGRTARQLFGRSVRIRLRNSDVTHMVEQSGGRNYLFTVSTIETEGETA